MSTAQPVAQKEILDRLGDRTFCHMFMEVCQDHPTRTALVDRDGPTVRRRTWADYRRLASHVAMGLRSLGVDHADRVAIMASNRPEHVIADVGIMLAGGTPISIHNTFTAEQTAYIADDAEVTIAVVEAEFLDKWRQLRDDGRVPSLQHLVLIGTAADHETELTFDDLLARGREALATGEGAFENSWRAVGPDDVCTVIYTSGTTGHPQGVQITHRNLMKQVERLQYEGQPVPLGMRIQHALFERLIFSKLRDRLGLDQCQYRLCGAAPISSELLLFFAALDLEILEVYGMTESTAVITSNRPGRVKLGTVGEPVEGTEVRIAEDGEVLARGPHITPGYLNRPEATAEAVDDEGWLHTGDLGDLDEDGYLKIIGRKTELIITASGKNLSPNNIEETIKGRSDLIAQVCAVGDDRPFIGALIVLDAELLPGWCESHGIPFESVAQAAERDEVKAEVARAVEAGNQELARVEQIKQYTIVPTERTPETEEMTPTMKLKRNVIHSKYSDVIDSLHGTWAGGAGPVLRAAVPSQ